MKLEMTYLGAIEWAELELADLTIICGENNTGKTYVTYLVYCLLTTWKQFIDVDLSSVVADLRKTGEAKFDLQKKVAAQWDDLCLTALERFVDNFPEMLASNPDLLKKMKLKIELPLGSSWKARAYQNELRSEEGHLLLTMTKAAKSGILELAAPSNHSEGIKLSTSFIKFIEERLLDFMLDEIVPAVFIASTERPGATTFKKQLNLATSNIIDLLSKAHKEGAESMTPHTVFETMYGRTDYALPVKHNVRFLNQLPSANAEEGPLCKAAPHLLAKFEAIVGGNYVTNKEGVTQFQPQGSRVKLGLGEASSSVRSLLIIWYWLKYFAKTGDMLMLDEPELNLHPANQRRLARFIAALVNHDVKVFLTTHSDYIVKELNTLIMLNQTDDKLAIIRKKLPDYTPDDKLDAKRLSLYMVRDELMLRPEGRRKTKTRTLVRAPISDTLGVEVASFDRTIDDINAVQEAIYYGLH